MTAMTMEKNPCYNCADRCLLCHASCIRYHEWVARRKAKLQTIRQAKARDNDADGFMIDQPKRLRSYQQVDWQKRHRDRHRKG